MLPFESSILKFHDGAWEQITTPLNFKGLLFRGDELLAYSNEGVFVSRDSGASWEGLNKGFFARFLKFVSAGNALIAHSENVMYKSLDNGESWTVARLGTNRNVAYGDKTLFAQWSVGPGNPAASRVLQSFADQGESWTALNNEIEVTRTTLNAEMDETRYISAVAHDGSNLYVAFEGSSYTFYEDGTHSIEKSWIFGGVHRSSDGGKTWTDISANLQRGSSVPMPIESLLPTTAGLLAKSRTPESSESIMLLKHGEEQWEFVHNWWDVSEYATGLFGNAEIQLAIDGEHQDIAISRDGGQTWEEQNDPFDLGGTFGKHELGFAYVIADKAYLHASIQREGESWQRYILQLEGSQWIDVTHEFPECFYNARLFQHGDHMFAYRDGRELWINDGVISSVAHDQVHKPELPDLNASAVALTVYPNPFDDQLTITLPQNLSLSGQVELHISDLRGGTVLRQTLIASLQPTLQVTLPQGLEAGVYFYRLHVAERVFEGTVLRR